MSAEGGNNPASRWCTSSTATLCVMKGQKSKPVQEQTRTINLSRTRPPSPPRCSLPGPSTSLLCPDCPVVLLGVGVGGEAVPHSPTSCTSLFLPPTLPRCVLPHWPSGCSCHTPSSYLRAFVLPKPSLPGTLSLGTQMAIPSLPSGLCSGCLVTETFSSHPTLNGHRSLPPELLPPHFPMTSTWLSA